MFNAVLEKLVRELKAKWRVEREGTRVRIGGDDLLQNLRFADDLLLIASSRAQVVSMLEDLMRKAAGVGLEVHMGKTKILSNGIGPLTRSTDVTLMQGKVQVLSPTESTMHLGRALNLRSTHDAEINHRIRRGWAKFGMFEKELTDKHYSFLHRVRLFNAVVTPSVLYCCCSWVMTASREQRLRGAQRKMLRTMLGKGRVIFGEADDISTQTATTGSSQEAETLEPWADWIQRVTHEAEEAMRIAGIPEWVEECRRRKWWWCGHVCRRRDSRWSHKILKWTPERGSRNQGHPFGCWSDDLNAFVECIDDDTEGKGNYEVWSAIAQNREAWKHL